MLKYPYVLLHTEENTKYYTFEVDGLESPFLAIEGSYKVSKNVSRRFRKEKEDMVDITTSIRLFPLKSITLYMFMQALGQAPQGTHEIEGLGKQTLYATHGKEDEQDLRNIYASLIEKRGNLSDWNFLEETTNPVVNGFRADGYLFLGTEINSNLERFHWLFRTTILGNLIILCVREVGSVENSNIGAVDSYVFSRELMQRALDLFKD